MKALAIRNVEAEEKHKWAAAADARMQNIANKSLFTLKQQQQATRMQQALVDCYSATVYEPNYRKTMITIKVAKPFVLRDRKALRALESQWDAQGVQKKDSAQGITYVIK